MNDANYGGSHLNFRTQEAEAGDYHELETSLGYNTSDPRGKA